ncbi:hypothetical protein FACS189472_03150 [Alphaproteobacteria bacterium]|nr:hypothetical protein FACS189472_03150 [Alphaproteobacteria bacterium]
MSIMYEKFLSFVENFYESEKHRLLNFFPVGIGVGICWYFLLDKEPDFRLNITVFSIIFIAFILCLFLRKYRNVLLIPLTIAAGFLLSQMRTNYVDTFMLSEPPERPISFVATIESCEKTENGLKFIVSDAKRKYDDEANELCRKFNKLNLTWRGKKAKETQNDYDPGSRVLFRVILSPTYPQSFPGAYDFRKQQYFKGISARGFIIKPPKTLEKSKPSSFGLYMEQLRHQINKKIEEHLGKDTAAVAEALTTGNTAGISKEIRSHFANSGIAHILAISGLHVGIIGFFVFWLFRIILCCFSRISMFYNVKKIAAVISWIITLFYLSISGCSVPSLRAFIMHTLIITAILLNRTPLTMRSVAIAATIIMVCTPEVILFPSFQMSFGAVIAIVAFYECDWQLPRFLSGLTSVIATTIVASIPTSIFSVFVFNQLTLNSILANIISIPLMSFCIMPVLVVALFLMIFNIAEPILKLAGYGIDILIMVADEICKLPGSFFVMHTPSNAVITTLVVSMLFLTLIHHRIRLLGLVGFVLGICGYFYQAIPDIFVSVDGKAIGIRTEDGVFFNDLRPFRSVTQSWTKSVGFEKRKKYNSKKCSKYISCLDDNTYVANIADKRIVVTSDDDYEKDAKDFLVFHVGDEENEVAEVVYLPSKERKSTASIKRPWVVAPHALMASPPD